MTHSYIPAYTSTCTGKYSSFNLVQQHLINFTIKMNINLQGDRMGDKKQKKKSGIFKRNSNLKVTYIHMYMITNKS